MRLKKVLTFSPSEKKYRICRIVWRKVPHDPGFSRSLSISLWPSILHIRKEYGAVFVTVLGLQAHYKHSRSGVFPD